MKTTANRKVGRSEGIQTTDLRGIYIPSGGLLPAGSVPEVVSPDEVLARAMRKINCRTTVETCPAAAMIRAAFANRHEREDGCARLGALLDTLECYVDNHLHIIYCHGRRQIVARSPGIRGWLRENCPELERHYKTLMRYKADIKRERLRRQLGDPHSATSMLNGTSAFDVDLPIHIQPGRTDLPWHRDTYDAPYNPTCWLNSQVHVDSRGRLYRENENYTRECRTFNQNRGDSTPNR